LTEPIDIVAYCKLDDHIIFLIQDSEVDHPDMDEARKCIEKIERQEVHKPILKARFCNIQWNELIEQEVENGIRTISEKHPKLKDNVIFKVRHYHFAKGPNVNPSCEVSYTRISNTEKERKTNIFEDIKSESTVFVYGPYDTNPSEADFLYREMDSYLKKYSVNEGLEFIFKKSNQRYFCSVL